MTILKRSFPFLGFCALVLSLSVSNAYGYMNECENLHVQIQNTTSKACVLAGSNVVSGLLTSDLPASIQTGAALGFDIEQSAGLGPDIKFKYQCGDVLIELQSQQHYCFLAAGDITGTVVQADTGLKAEHQAVKGSLLDPKTWGMSTWTISEGPEEKVDG